MLSIDHDTRHWHPAEVLNAEAARLAYLVLVAEEEGEAALAQARVVVARARKLAERSG
jgi:DNA-binding phage protein